MHEADPRGQAADGSDVYEGISWSDRLQYGALGYALDPKDADGRKNHYIDSVHRVGLRRGFGTRRFRRALDFGCGCGRLLDELTARSSEVYGVDRTAPALEIARKSNIVPADHLALWRNGPMQFPDGFFDLVISVYVMLTPEILEGSVRELRRVCADDALVILVEQVNAGRGLTVERYTAALEGAGLRVESASAIRQAPGSRFLRLATLFRWPSGFLRLLARAEAASLRGRTPETDTHSYFDYLIAARPTS
jgi:SAM-dependent methyltransferase